MAKRIAINGFGRIGRLTLRNLLSKKDIEVVVYLDKFQPLSKEHERIASNIKGKYDVPCLMVAYHPGKRSSAFPMTPETVKSSIDRLSKTSDYVVSGSTVDSIGIDELIGAIGQGQTALPPQ